MAAAGLLLVGGAVVTGSAAASGGATASSFVPITPCRLVDTRSGPDNVGARSTPLGAGETFVAMVRGSNGNCTGIPTDATGATMNVTIVNPTSSSFLTVFPADASTLPVTANLNWKAGQAPTPNAVTAALSADGQLGFYNLSGSVDVIVDVVGYFAPSSSGTGPAGPKGDPGTNGATPARVLWVASEQGDFTTVGAALAAIGTTLPAAGPTTPYLIRVAPGTHSEPGGITMRSDVSIEGSGRDITTITCACGGSAFGATSATLRAVDVDRAEVSALTIWNTGGAAQSAGIVVTRGGLLLSLHDLRVIARGGSGQVDGIVVEGDSALSQPRLTDVLVDAVGAASGVTVGMVFNLSEPSLARAEVDVSGSVTTTGIAMFQAYPVVSDVSVYTSASGGAGAVATGMMITSSIVSLADARVSAWGGGGTAVGLQTSSAAVTADGLQASASGGVTNTAVETIGQTVTITDLRAQAVGGATAMGVHSMGTSLTITGGSAEGTGATKSYGVRSSTNGGRVDLLSVVAKASSGTDVYALLADAMGVLAVDGGLAWAQGGTTTTNGAYALGASLTLTGTTVTATGGPSARAVVTDGATVHLADVSLTASGGTTNYGVHSLGSPGSAQTSVRGSSIASSGTSVRNDNGVVYVDDTQLSSAAAGPGTTVCRNAYTSTLSNWGASCT